MTQPTSSNPEGPEQDVAMPLTDHLTELRRRLVICVAFIFGGFVVATGCEMEFQQPILSLFRRPLDARNIPLVFDELTEPFFTYLRIGLYTSLFLTFPLLLTQIWGFVRPALYSHERQAFWPFLIVSYPLFVGGGLFGYFAVLPFGYDFFLSFQNEFTLPSLRMGAYLSLTVQLLFAFGMVFEMPTIVFVLARMGVLDAQWLRENRKYSFVIVFIVASILTPPDVFTQTLMAGPLIILYEISIWVAKFAAPKSSPTTSLTET
jgi:sec-independent protein translocase protein TatC